MKVGDLVTHNNWASGRVGLVIEMKKYRGDADVKVLWGARLQLPRFAQNSAYLKVLTIA